MKKRYLFLIMILALALIVSACTWGKSDTLVDEEEVKDEVKDDVIVNEKPMLMPSFLLKDTGGEELSSDIFADYDMTIISLWQSTWGPCIGELEALNVIYDEYKDKGVNVLGIALDDVESYGDAGLKRVAELVDFSNVIADSDYMMKLLEFIRSTPTAIVVNSQGEFLLPPIIGSGGKDKDIKRFRTMIDELQD